MDQFLIYSNKEVKIVIIPVIFKHLTSQIEESGRMEAIYCIGMDIVFEKTSNFALQGLNL